MSDLIDAAVRQRVKEILRRDLKLGPDAVLENTAPLFNSDSDLDSLDMLMLVASIEREFGLRIPNASVGESVFRSVDSLAAYITKNAAHAPAATAAKIDVPLSRLPHAPPFRFISGLSGVVAGKSGSGHWFVDGSEPFFAGHFPGHPLVPGVLIAEALAQLSGLVLFGGADAPAAEPAKLAHIDVRFERPVVPPARIELHSTYARSLGTLNQFDVSATVNDQPVARGTLALHAPENSTR